MDEMREKKQIYIINKGFEFILLWQIYSRVSYNRPPPPHDY